MDIIHTPSTPTPKNQSNVNILSLTILFLLKKQAYYRKDNILTLKKP